MHLRRTLSGLALGLALLSLLDLATPATGQAQPQQWGEVKGQVVWAADKLPEKVKANVNKDVAFCLKNGPVYTNDYVVNPKNKGVRWVLVYLVDANNAATPLPIHKDLTAIPAKPAVIDQPCCEFEPRLLPVREGQKVEVRNSATVSHNFFINGGALGPNANPLMAPNAAPHTIDKIMARPLPIPFNCNLHPWMKGYIASFKHPYFAVTDEDGKFTLPKAPAGKYRLILWQETRALLFYDPKTGTKGPVIEIKANGITDLGQLKLEPSKE